MQQRLRHGERPLVLRRAQIAAQTPLREGSEFAGKAECVVERLTRCAQPVDETDMRCFRALDGASGEDHVVGERRTDEPGQADRAAVHEGHTPPPAIHAERGVLGGDSQIAPHGELKSAGDGETLDRSDDRLREVQAGRAHRARTGEVDPVAVPGRDRLEVSACTERAVRSGEDRHRQRIVLLEGGEGLEQFGRGRPVDRVPAFGAIDGDHEDGVMDLGVDSHGRTVVPLPGRPRHSGDPNTCSLPCGDVGVPDERLRAGSTDRARHRGRANLAR